VPAFMQPKISANVEANCVHDIVNDGMSSCDKSCSQIVEGILPQTESASVFHAMSDAVIVEHVKAGRKGVNALCRKVGSKRAGQPKGKARQFWRLRADVFREITDQVGPFTVEVFPPAGEGPPHLSACFASAKSFIGSTLASKAHLFMCGLNPQMHRVLRHVNRQRVRDASIQFTCVVPYVPDAAWFKLVPGRLVKLFPAGAQIFSGDRAIVVRHSIAVLSTKSEPPVEMSDAEVAAEAAAATVDVAD